MRLAKAYSGAGLTALLGLCLWGMPLELVRAQSLRFETVKGKVRIEGTSNFDDWQVESRAVGGWLETGPGFPTNSAPEAASGKKAARGEVFLEVRSLKSIEKDGKPFSNLMDEIMHAKLKRPQHPTIRYRLADLVWKATPKSPDQACRFEARGELIAAGATNLITLPVTVTPLEGQRLRLTATTALRMTDFQIDPPAPKIALGIVKTGDEVKISFEWVVAEAHSRRSGEAAVVPPR